MSQEPVMPVTDVTLQFRARDGGVSIERLFADVAGAFPPDIRWKNWYAPRRGAKAWPMLVNLFAARANRSRGVTHVTGHEHYLAVLLTGKRTVLTIHDAVGAVHLKGWRRWVYVWLQLKLPVRRAAVTTVISQKTADEVVALTGISPAKIRVVPNCVSHDFSYTPQTFRTHKTRLLQVGTGWNKNVARVAEAVAGLDVELTIIGKDLRAPDRAALEDHGVAYTLTGRISDAEVLEHYRSCDIVVFASEYEGFGLPILEAQGMGRAIVTSSIEPMLSVAGPDACCVDPFDVVALRHQIVRLIEDHPYRESVIEKGLANVRQYRPQAVAARYAEVYRGLSRR